MDGFLYMQKTGLFHCLTLVFVHNLGCRERLISVFFLLRHVCWYKVLHHRLYLQEVPQAEAAL